MYLDFILILLMRYVINLMNTRNMKIQRQRMEWTPAVQDRGGCKSMKEASVLQDLISC